MDKKTEDILAHYDTGGLAHVKSVQIKSWLGNCPKQLLSLIATLQMLGLKSEKMRKQAEKTHFCIIMKFKK